MTQLGYIAVGNSRVNGFPKIFIVKLNQLGDTLWNKYFDLKINAAYDSFWVEETSDKGFILTGDGEGVNSDAYLIKIDYLGNPIWVKTFGGNDLDQGVCVKQLEDKGFILLIRSFSYSSMQNILLIKTDQNGNEVWRKFYGDKKYHEYGLEIQIIKNSGFIIAGWKVIPNQPAKMFLIRTDIFGDTLWTKTYDKYFKSAAYSIDKTGDNGFIIGGIADSTNNNYPLSYVIKTDSVGKIEWEKRYASAYREICYSIRSLPNNRYAFCGRSDSSFSEYERAILRIIDGSGNTMIEKYFRASPGQNTFRSLELTKENGFILCGFSEFILAKSYLVCTDSLGNIKPVGILNNNQILKNYSIDQNYPNPFNSQTIIKYTLFKPAYFQIDLYDITGKFISTLINEFMFNGNYSYTFDPQKYNLTSGIYFYRSTINFSGDLSINSKFLKLLYLK
ncbi:MAG TPA: T9SS type A sorting domain-containing protein [Ignavibacteria bacterium]|nr:T9SS type A sorting domain-containing protein [Ignavibacteria bacterium]